MSKQWQDFVVLICLIAGYLFIIIHHLRGLRLSLPHGRRVRLLFILVIWIVAVPITFVSLGAPTEFLRVLTAPFDGG